MIAELVPSAAATAPSLTNAARPGFGIGRLIDAKLCEGLGLAHRHQS
jgi:hypothetical protein